MKAVSKFITTGLSAVIVCLAILLVGVRLFGLAPYTVLSSSMEPAYPVGSLIYVQDIPVNSIQVGDTITFVMNEALVVATHRVVEVNPEQETFRTKGDANENIDGAAVHFENVLGRVSFSIPYLGYVAHFINSGQGRWVAIAIVLFLLLLLLLPDLMNTIHPEKKERAVDAAEHAETETLIKRATLPEEEEEGLAKRS